MNATRELTPHRSRNANEKRRFSRRLPRLLLVCLAVYLVASAGVAVFQRKLIYFPPRYSSQQVTKAATAAGLERWTNASGGIIGMKRLSPQQPAEARALIVYGNASWSVGCARYVDDIQSLAAFDVFVLEYPGYADRAGSPSEGSIFGAADQALQALGTNRPVYAVGESLGSGVAAYLAGSHPDRIAGLILLSPYDRLASVAKYHWPFLPVGLMLLDRYPSEEYLRDYNGPVGIVVDGRDRVVPEKFGLRLYDAYGAAKRLWRFPNGRHISIMEPAPKFWGQVLNFWQTNAATKPG